MSLFGPGIHVMGTLRVISMVGCPGGIVAPALNPGNMDYWITDRIPIRAAAPASGSSYDTWITDRIPFSIWCGRAS